MRQSCYRDRTACRPADGSNTQSEAGGTQGFWGPVLPYEGRVCRPGIISNGRNMPVFLRTLLLISGHRDGRVQRFRRVPLSRWGWRGGGGLNYSSGRSPSPEQLRQYFGHIFCVPRIAVPLKDNAFHVDQALATHRTSARVDPFLSDRSTTRKLD